MLNWWGVVQDELLWAAAWLYSATRDRTYFKYVTEEALHAVVDEFNWDLKYAGVQILLSKVSLFLVTIYIILPFYMFE